LSESEVRFEATCWKIALIVQLTGIRYPFVNQYQARRVSVHQLPKDVTRTCGLIIVGANSLVGFLGFIDPACTESQLPCQFAPKCSDYCSVRLCDWITGRNLVSDQNNSVDFWRTRYCSLL